MAWSRLLECPDCGHTWRFLAMVRSEKNPPCPMCEAKPAEALAAPALNRGAAPVTAMKIPENRTKAIDLAMRVISDDNGGANMKSTSRPGEVVAIAPTVPEAQRPRWGAGGRGAMPAITMGNVATLKDGGGPKRSELIDNLHRFGGQRNRRHEHMKPVYRDKNGLPT